MKEFAAYTLFTKSGFSKFLNEGRSSEKIHMQEMYLEIIAVINKEIELGHLPTTT